MSLDQAARELVALMDILIACAGVVFATAAVLLATAAELRLRAPRPMPYAIAVPPGPAPAPELLVTHLHSLLRPVGWLSPSPEIAIAALASCDDLRLVVSMSERHRSSLTASLDAIWPGATLQKTDATVRTNASRRWRPTMIATQRPSALTSAAPAFVRALTRTSPGEQLSFEIALRRASGRRAPLWGLVRDQTTRTSRRSTAPTRRDVVGPMFDASVTIAARAATSSRAQTLVRDLTPNVEALCTGTGLHLERPPRLGNDGLSTERGLAPLHLAFLLPLAEIAVAAVHSSASVATEGERFIGRRTAGRGDTEVRISLAASRHHLHVLGPTGTGKSTLLLNLIAQDIAAGRGCAVFDPKGDLVRELLLRIPRRRVDDVVYVGSDEGSRAVGINPLQLSPHEDPTVAAENVLSIFKRVYADSWGHARTTYSSRAC